MPVPSQVDPADAGPRRPRTLDLRPGTPIPNRTPFPIPASASRARTLDGESARARFSALKSLRSEGPPPPPADATVEPDDPAHTSHPLPAPEVPSAAPPHAAPLHASPPHASPPHASPPHAQPRHHDSIGSEHIKSTTSSPGPESVPWAEARRDRLAPKDLSPKIDRVGLLPLDVDAAVQQAIWRGDSPLHEILARHGLDEITWRDHLRRRGEALRDEAQQGSSDRAAAARSALDRAREPTASPPEPELDLQRYATLRALLADSGDENAILAAHGVPREVWDREHRAYRKRLRSDPDLAERFKAALEEAKGHARSPAPAAPSKKKTIAKKPRSGAQAAGKNGPARARSTAPPPGEKEPGAARSRPA